jgi:DnaJ-class molecular chaperone
MTELLDDIDSADAETCEMCAGQGVCPECDGGELGEPHCDLCDGWGECPACDGQGEIMGDGFR